MRYARAITLVLTVVSLLAVAGIAVAASAFDGAKSATARFHDLDQAQDAGYTVRVADAAGIECIAQAGEGAMGIHMLNPTLLNATIEADQPEVLVYEPRNDGTLKLVALEYLVFVADWEGTSPPALFGREFDLVPAGNRYGLPPFYALHAWIWKPNPSGILHPWNPRVDCSGS
jgi:hypothetical protein